MDVVIDGVPYVPATRDEVALSILVPSVSTRRATFAPKIMDQLFGQHERLDAADRQRVEILIVTDAGREGGMIVGDKRNALVRMARGKYVAFVDDDDRVSDDYITSLLKATSTGCDVIVFDAMVSLNSGAPKVCHYNKFYRRDANTPAAYERLPNHLMAVKRILALQTPFAGKQCGEDADYAVRLLPLLKTQEVIDRVLYHYDFNDTTTETQGARGQRPLLTVVEAATVDVVILSKATTPELQSMTQKAIDTCIAGVDPYKVNVIVIEQQQYADYQNAHTIYKNGDFNYNKFANEGVRAGRAPWVMIANNDLLFEPGWLHALLETGHECVSPLDPLRRAHRGVTHDEAGWQNGLHFSGWCFMVRRSTWEKIGGFDECVWFWCSDNVVIEQLRAIGVMPRLVHAARVKHLGSQTMPKPPDDASWQQVKIFNEKYRERQIFRTDPRYIAYLRRTAA